MRKMIFLVNRLNEGGAQKIIAFLASACQKRGDSVYIISMEYGDITVNLNENITVFFLNGKDRPKKIFLKKLLFDIHLILQIRKIYQQIHPDIICSFLPYISTLAYLASINLGYIYKIVSERENPYSLSKTKKFIYTWIYSKYDYIVFQTSKAKEYFPINIQNKSMVIPNPCIPRDKVIAPYTGEREDIIIAAGRLEKIKGFQDLIKAFYFVTKHNPELTLKIYGEGSERNNLEKLIVKYNLEEKIQLVGSVKDVFKIERKAKAFVLTSYGEGIPNVLMEALAVGLPCIATDCNPGGPRLLLANGNRGELVRVGDIEALAHSICKVVNDSNLSNKYSQNAVEVIEEFSPDRILKQWFLIFSFSKKSRKQM